MKLPKLIDLNGRYGTEAASTPEFKTCNDLICHMDRLGISKAVTYKLPEGSLLKNIEIVEEIKNNNLDDRLIPCLTVSPSDVYNEEVRVFLKNTFKSAKARVLRVKPGSWQPKILSIEPILQDIAPFKPLIIFDSRDNADTDDILHLSGVFKDVPMVYSQCMWDIHPILFDLMRRRDNIYADTSWLHTMGTIELIVREFGVERLLFGTGSKVHNGASIASLMKALITEEQRDMIAFKNIEKIIGIKSNSKTSIEYQPKSIYWNSLLSGTTINDTVIDAHGHLNEYDEKNEDIEVKNILEKMDSIGIDTMVISSMEALESDPVEGNNRLEKRLKPYGDRFKGYAVYNPYYKDELLEKLDDYFSGGFFIGFKLLCSYWGVPITDERFNPVWEYADKFRRPVLIHTWNDSFDSPAMLTEIVKKYRKAVFILAHSGGEDEGRREAIKLVLNNKNVYLEFCGSFASSIPWEETIKEIGNDRVLFGTDATGHDSVWEIGRLLSLDLPDNIIKPVLGDNFIRILSGIN